jgi:CRISPR/Cas system-associated exonuclease Cas4 (RecB family)
MVLFKAAIQVAVGPMPNTFAELRSDRPRIRVVAVSRDPVRRRAGDRPCRSQDALCSSKVPVLVEYHIDQRTVPINRTIQILPMTVHPDIRLVDIAATAHLSFASPTEILGQCRREFGLPITDGLVTEHEASY